MFSCQERSDSRSGFEVKPARDKIVGGAAWLDLESFWEVWNKWRDRKEGMVQINPNGNLGARANLEAAGQLLQVVGGQNVVVGHATTEKNRLAL